MKGGLSETEMRSFRAALAAFPTGIVVATAWNAEAGPLGMTMNSFTSISLRPPLIMFSIDRRAASLPAWLKAPGYAVNVLASGQEDLSNRFARALTEKWSGIHFDRGLHGAPLLNGTIARFECSSHEHMDGGDHVIFLGRVERYTRDDAVDPLVFYRNRYGAVVPMDAASEPVLPPAWPLSIHY